MKTQKIILEILEDFMGDFVAPGELYREAQIAGYVGKQEKLLKTADEMAKERVIISRRRGIEQNNWYRLPSQN